MTKMNTPIYASGCTVSAASHASTAPAMVMATIARKIGLGRTDWRSGRIFTSRSYRPEQSSQLRNSRHRRFMIVGAGNHVEHRAAGVDVWVQEFSDIFGCPVRRIALEGLERHLVEGLHPLGEWHAGGLAGGAEATPDVDRVRKAARVPAHQACMLSDLIHHRTESPGRDPDSQPAVTEPACAPHRRIGPAADGDRDGRRRRRNDLGVADREELAVKADRLAVG